MGQMGRQFWNEEQVRNFGLRGRGWLVSLLGWLERFMVRRSKLVIVICPELETSVREISTQVPMLLIENASGEPPAPGRGASTPT